MAISRCNAAGFRLILGLALLTTTWLMLTPRPMALPDFDWADKLSHALAFMGLAFLADASWPERGFDWPKYLPLALYGIVIELIQQSIPNRFFSVGDIAANIAGLLLYGALLLTLLRRLQIR